ncbi:hypothetical protein TorRG33x02_042730, partial [Trema orientale]
AVKDIYLPRRLKSAVVGECLSRRFIGTVKGAVIGALYKGPKSRTLESILLSLAQHMFSQSPAVPPCSNNHIFRPKRYF